VPGSYRSTLLVAIAVLFSVYACAAVRPTDPQAGGQKMAFSLSSSDFENGSTIPKNFTCDGADVSPELSWSDAPKETQSFALIADDPDAPVGTWTHWVIYNLAADTKSTPQNVNKIDQLPDGVMQGRNDFRKIGYGGPCPPTGKPHRYFFRLYALDTKLNLKAGASRQEVEQAMNRHVVGQAELMGKYGR
jgi:Raf kinase inhibitor-like YbhB/YbcL family protein